MIRSSEVVAILTLFACLLVCSPKANAAPVYYTYSGVVTGVTDPQGLIAAQGLGVGSEVSYTFMVDMNLPASQRQVNGTVETHNDVTKFSTWGANRFLVDYYRGNALSKDGNGWFTNPASAGYDSSKYAEYNYGTNQWRSGYYGPTYLGLVRMNSDDNIFAISRSSYFPWGTSVTNLQATNTIFSSADGTEHFLNIILNFDGSSTTAPVPVPGAVWLLGSGLIGIVGIRRMFKK